MVGQEEAFPAAKILFERYPRFFLSSSLRDYLCGHVTFVETLLKAHETRERGDVILIDFWITVNKNCKATLPEELLVVVAAGNWKTS